MHQTQWSPERVPRARTGHPGLGTKHCLELFAQGVSGPSSSCEDPLEKEMAIHSSTLAWKISWTEEPDRLQSTGSQRVGHASTHGHVPHEHRCVLRTPRGLSTRGQGGSCPKRVPCPRGGPFHTRGTSPQRGGLSTVGGLPVGAWPVPEGALSTPGGPLHRGVVCL